MMIINFKDFKTVESIPIKCTVETDIIKMTCKGFTATYKHNQVNELIELHSKILSDKTMKDVRKFINESREPEQMSLF